jgi:hypothetical protein
MRAARTDPPARRLPRRIARIVCVAIILAACGGERTTAPAPAPPSTAAASPSAPSGAPEAEPTAHTADALDEASARLLIAARFRAAGFRVVEDALLRVDSVELTLDGFDPARRVGYEYVAADERDADLTDDERAAVPSLPGVRVLIVESSGAESIAGTVDRFLAGVGPGEPEPR